MPTPRRRRVMEEEHENHERWLITYADMITLLMVLFIVLFAISQVDKAKFEASSKYYSDDPEFVTTQSTLLSEKMRSCMKTD